MFKTQEECIALLEQIRWGKQPRCPYCNSTHSAPLRRERRHHCNECFTSYSVTVGTLFHKTHVDLPKWFQAIKVFKCRKGKVGVRELALEIKVNKDTASYMLARVRKAASEESRFFTQLCEVIVETDC